MSSNFSSLRKSMNKRVSLLRSSPSVCQNAVTEDQSSTIDTPVDLNNSFSSSLQHVKNTSFQSKFTPTKSAKRLNPLMSYSKNKGRIQTRVLDSEWLNQAEDDLSDLIDKKRDCKPDQSASPELKKSSPLPREHTSPNLVDANSLYTPSSTVTVKESEIHDQGTITPPPSFLKETESSNVPQEESRTFFGLCKRQTDEFDATHDVFGAKSVKETTSMPNDVSSQPNSSSYANANRSGETLIGEEQSESVSTILKFSDGFAGMVGTLPKN